VQSVCALETIPATPGRLDDFESAAARKLESRDVALPAAGAGTWSWFPDRAEVGASGEAGNHALRLAGRGLGQWSGLSLAFVSGSRCYDATATHGVRFKIRGSGATVVLNVVSAETQPQTLGGDATVEGGHFHRVLEAGAAWRTVSVSWSELQAPTWGQTSLRSLAVGKLQALSWTVADTARDFSIELDDVELY
jgi:hypothetical protein